jgi:hypothetical protein
VGSLKAWFNNCFKDGRMSADSERQQAKMLMSLASIMEDRRLTIREVADEVGISRGSENIMLTVDLGM